MKTSRSLALALCLVPLGLQAAGPEPLSHSWGGYHWARRSNPFNLKVGDNLTSASWKTQLAAAAGDWSASNVLDMTVVAGQAKGRCRPTTGRVEVCNDTYGANGWLGLAQIWLSGGHIAQGVVKVNDTYFSRPQYNNTAERRHVMCQEIGHTIGLDHQSESGESLNTCMDYYFNTSDGDTKSTTPNAHDYSQLSSIYAHLDSTTTVLGQAEPLPEMPPAMRQIDFEGPGQWGELVERAPDGRFSVYELDFGNDNRLRTVVTWAPGEERIPTDRDDRLEGVE